MQPRTSRVASPFGRCAHIRRYIAGSLIAIMLISPFSVYANYEDTHPGEKLYYLLEDHLGSIDVVTDEDGNVVERRDFLPYGEERVGDPIPPSTQTDTRFTGKELDEETGLMYYGARYYDPITGRFISQDPFLLRIDQIPQEERNEFLSDPQNLNAYTYARNNPLKYVDPDGEFAIFAAAIVASAFIATFMSSYQNVAAPDIGSPRIHTRSEPEIITSMAMGEVTGALLGYGVGKVVQKIGQFGFKTIAQLKAYRKLVSEGVEAKSAAKEIIKSINPSVAEAKEKILEYLGNNIQRIENPKNGNILYQSKDGLKEVRFDLKDPYPHKNPHTHVVEYEKTLSGKTLIDNKAVYPRDVEAR